MKKSEFLVRASLYQVFVLLSQVPAPFATHPVCRREAVKTMDMSVVSRQLEQETRGALRGTVNGRIPRMLLIQVDCCKV